MNQKYNIEHMQILARSKNGQCLSEKYNRIKMKWKCQCLYEWETAPHHIREGHWCPKCGGNAKDTIENMRIIAYKNQGQCLSDIYINSHTKLLWKCANGHEWKSTPSSIKNNKTWCPFCTKFLKEEQCRFVFDSLTGQKFIKDRKILNGLELDGYCDDLKLAFEYNGEHHYRHIQGFSKENLINVQKRDARKSQLCLSLGIVKIDIPFWVAKNKRDLEIYIKENLESSGIKISQDVDWSKFKIINSEMDNLKLLAASRNGKFISNLYEGATIPHTWLCNVCHYKWDASPGNIKFGTWCPRCAKVLKGNINEMRKLAQTKSGLCLSTKYSNSRNKLTWKCNKGHIWDATPDSIKRNHWCPECAGCRKKTIEEMKKIAKENGGKCLSDKYVSAHSHLGWQCCQGHKWKAQPRHVRNGSWCPICKSRKKFKSWEDAQNS